LDLRAGSLQAVQFKRADDGWELHAAASERVCTDQEAVAGPEALAALKSLVDSDAFVGRRVVAALPNPEVDIRPVTLPQELPMDDAEAFLEMLQLEGRTSLLYPPEEAVLDYLPMASESSTENGARRRALLVAARKDHVYRFLAMLSQAGLECDQLDISPCATLRALNREVGCFAVLDLEAYGTEVTIAEGMDLHFSRTLRKGAQTLVDAVANGFEVDSAEARDLLMRYGVRSNAANRDDWEDVTGTGEMRDAAISSAVLEACSKQLQTLIDEIRRTVEYFSRQRHGSVPEELLLSGPLLPPGLDDFLSESLNLPTRMANGLHERVATDTEATEYSGEGFTTAAGLALREAVA
jgi:type IV pilus assembly protein PilM